MGKSNSERNRPGPRRRAPRGRLASGLGGQQSGVAFAEENRGAMKAVAIVGLLACLAAGCSALPTAGPTVKEIRQQEIADDQLRFALVDIDDNVVTIQNAAPPESFSARFKKYGKPPQPKI